ncbi:MAG: hypothetical protein HY718_05015, partial [Planctomycetes bacterium]|nr:hypothetical protein [Planctomycetota bacterium]
VARRTDADPSRVLATSFSSGGYIAHYMVNRHPERFSCLAVRGSNFSENMLNPSQIAKYRNMKIAIFFGQNDFKLCADESLRAVEWYRQHRFDVTAKKVGGLGHERKPEVAAAFFASTIGVNPKTPPDLGPLVMMDVMPRGGLRSPRPELSPPPRTVSPPQPAEPQRGAGAAPPIDTPDSAVSAVRTPPPRPAVQPGPAPTVQRPPASTRIVPRRTETPKRPTGQNSPEVGKPAPRTPERTKSPIVFTQREQVDFAPSPAGIRVHGETAGKAPMQVSLSVDLPDQLKDGATILWTDNERPIPAVHAFETLVLLREPGQHRIAAHIITADDRKLVLRQTITVLSPSSQPAS